MNKSLKTSIIIMGVAGSGKTTVGKNLAKKLDCPFLEGDDYHPRQNLAKMKKGIPLNDTDRLPWLQVLNKSLRKKWQETGRIILTCSALKTKYRHILSQNISLLFIYLKIDKDVVIRRLQKRKNHFFNISLINSQFSILEEPENALIIDANKLVEEMLKEVYRKIHL